MDGINPSEWRPQPQARLESVPKKSPTPWLVLGGMVLVSALGFGRGFAGFLLILAILTFVLALGAFIAGSGRWIWLANRAQAGFAAGGALLVLIISLTVAAITVPSAHEAAALPPASVSSSSSTSSTSPPASSARPSTTPSAAITSAEPVPLVQPPVTPAPAIQPPVQPVPVQPVPPPVQQPVPQQPASVYYPNCDTARAAGVAPLHRGDAGYRPELDRDNDGIACEPKPKGKK